MEQRCGIDVERVTRLKQREEARFARRHPRCLALRERARQTMPHGVPTSWMASSFAHPPVFGDEGHGAWFTRVDGIRFLDTNIGDKSTFCGLDPGPVVRAVNERIARGGQFVLPTEDALVVAEELAGRLGGGGSSRR